LFFLSIEALTNSPHFQGGVPASWRGRGLIDRKFKLKEKENNHFYNRLPRQLAGTPPSKGGELITSPSPQKNNSQFSYFHYFIVSTSAGAKCFRPIFLNFSIHGRKHFAPTDRNKF